MTQNLETHSMINKKGHGTVNVFWAMRCIITRYTKNVASQCSSTMKTKKKAAIEIISFNYWIV